MHPVQRQKHLDPFDFKAPAWLSLHAKCQIENYHSTGWKLLLGFIAIYLWAIFFSDPLQPYFDYTTSNNHISKSFGKSRNPAYLIRATHGAVAAENKRCSDIGVDVLKSGGNAVDAAISATFCTGVVNMFS